ncbi:SDR family NAD(P)-dependent oxidoreductase [Cumulibacter soli]|uniref:SDR family NAD(P)-dependent oxidoreductase n=1 Tax=Cumulibacter soli TaxID=2546344 RepID=UPI0010674A78|nr:SDR family oxidoreductase [Cumulibacter soli]
MKQAALITGGSGAIGRALCREAAARGFDVVYTYNTTSAHNEGLTQDISRLGRRCLPVRCDLGVAGDLEVLVRSAERFGDVALLVNNAGIAESRSVSQFDIESWNRAIAVNLTAPACLSTLLSSTLRRNEGAITNIGTVGALTGSMHSIAYGSSKAGLIGLTRTLARMLAPSVRVNCVCPGPIATDMLESLTDAQLDQIRQATPLQRIGAPEEVAQVVLDVSGWRYCNGQTLVIDGGRVMT